MQFNAFLQNQLQFKSQQLNMLLNEQNMYKAQMQEMMQSHQSPRQSNQGYYKDQHGLGTPTSKFVTHTETDRAQQTKRHTNPYDAPSGQQSHHPS